jgi:hypothetical protein
MLSRIGPPSGSCVPADASQGLETFLPGGIPSGCRRTSPAPFNGEQRRRHFEAERFAVLRLIDHQLGFCLLLDRGQPASRILKIRFLCRP